MSELLIDIKERKPIRVKYDGTDFGIYEWNEVNKRYESYILSFTLEELLEIIKDNEHFIKIERVR